MDTTPPLNNLEAIAVTHFRAQYRYTVFTLGRFWRFREGAWRPITLDTVRAELTAIYAQLRLQPTSRVLGGLIDQLCLALAMPPAAWNKDLGLIPCRNGLLHLGTSSLLPHTATSYQTRTLAAVYEPTAICPVWDAFLASSLPASADFVQEFAGLALTFDTRYEVAVWLYGPPGSGKSTFLSGLQTLLGDRAGQLDLLTLGRRRLVPAQLFGCSLLLSAEQPLADLEHDNLLNTLISGETLFIQPPPGSLSHEPDLLTLRAKWIWAMVTLPRFNRSTSGLYRRVRLVPFLPRAEADRDPSLKSRLALEASGILNWALAGLARLTARGRFQPPPAVAAAGDQFRQSNDLVAQFLAEACRLYPQARVSASRLYQHYVAWCRRQSARPESVTAVAAAWENNGFKRVRIAGRSYWLGLCLRADSTPTPGGPIELSENGDSVATVATPATDDTQAPQPPAADATGLA